MADFLPSRDEDLNSWAINFSALITIAPTTYGLVAADATALAALVSGFTASLTASTNPATRSAVTVATKNTARAVLTTDVRSLARRIQATPTVTAAQKTALGLPVADAIHTPTPPPSTKPVLALIANSSRIQTIRLVDETTPTKRARPAGASGAEIYSYVPAAAETPPADLEQWRFEGMATKSEFDVDFNGGDVGKTSYILARWYNRKGEVGPSSAPITGTVAA